MRIVACAGSVSGTCVTAAVKRAAPWANRSRAGVKPFVARYGGEELAVLARLDTEAARRIGEFIRTRLESQAIEFEGPGPFSHDGEPGSVLDVLLGHGVHLEHACGGKCACTTCHVIVKEGEQNLSPSTDSKYGMLAAHSTPSW